MLESKEENPKGLHKKYHIQHADGTPVDPQNEYFVLKVFGTGDPAHLKASQKAILKYADEIEDTYPELAADIRDEYDE
ncbi:MAG: hypothetical protein K9J21_07240 [Bacteroidales bacterium]|nr:hypothetical protein [Bacteroidales bacterium]